MDDLKAQVYSFWDDTSCGEIYAKGLVSAEKLASQAEARYRLEPYIRKFARFEEGIGRDVLEIGVGMGADHLEWAKNKPRRLAGIDLTPRAVDWTARRLDFSGYISDLRVADAEHLPFETNSFDIVYSWGVLHHSPDTPAAFREAHRVLRPGGILRAMIYHRPSIVGLLLWTRYGLAAGHPGRRLTDLYAHHLESPGTKGYTVSESRQLLAGFRTASVCSAISFGDLLLGEVGQHHHSHWLGTAKKYWPRDVIRRLPALGLLLLIEAKK